MARTASSCGLLALLCTLALAHSALAQILPAYPPPRSLCPPPPPPPPIATRSYPPPPPPPPAYAPRPTPSPAPVPSPAMTYPPPPRMQSPPPPYASSPSPVPSPLYRSPSPPTPTHPQTHPSPSPATPSPQTCPLTPPPTCPPAPCVDPIEDDYMPDGYEVIYTSIKWFQDIFTECRVRGKFFTRFNSKYATDKDRTAVQSAAEAWPFIYVNDDTVNGMCPVGSWGKSQFYITYMPCNLELPFVCGPNPLR